MKGHKIRLLAILLLFGILLCGCNVSNYIYTEDSLKKVAEKSLKKKYGEEFVVHSAWAKNAEVFYADCSPKNNSEIVFRADVYKSGKGVYADGYVQGVVANSINEFLEPDIKLLYENCYTRVSPPSYYNVYQFENPKNVTISEYLEKNELDYVGYNIFVLDTECDKLNIDNEYNLFSQKILKDIRERRIPSMAVTVYFVDDRMYEYTKAYYSTHTTYDSDFDQQLEICEKMWWGYPENNINISREQFHELRTVIQENLSKMKEVQ